MNPKKLIESKSIEHVYEMAIESLSPDSYEKIVKVLRELCDTRKISNSLPTIVKPVSFKKTNEAIGG